MVTYGFYNSVDHDRTYDATQVSELFDGLINPGVYNSIGQKFKVEAVSNSFQVSVGTGRAWFNHTWTKNDAPLILNLPAPPTMADRYRSDAIVIDINSDIKVRENKITYVCGEESANSNPPHPTLASGTHTQIPLAYIRRGAENAVETSIDPEQVNYVVGTVPECPWVVGVLQSVDISVYVQRWETAWNTWFTGKQQSVIDDINAVHTARTNAEASINTDKAAFKAFVTEQVSEFTIWMADKKSSFDSWFANLQYILDGDVAGHLQNEIEALDNRVTPIEKGGTGNNKGYIRTGFKKTSEYTIGEFSTSEGMNTVASGKSSHAEGAGQYTYQYMDDHFEFDGNYYRSLGDLYPVFKTINPCPTIDSSIVNDINIGSQNTILHYDDGPDPGSQYGTVSDFSDDFATSVYIAIKLTDITDDEIIKHQIGCIGKNCVNSPYYIGCYRDEWTPTKWNDQIGDIGQFEYQYYDEINDEYYWYFDGDTPDTSNIIIPNIPQIKMSSMDSNCGKTGRSDYYVALEWSDRELDTHNMSVGYDYDGEHIITKGNPSGHTYKLDVYFSYTLESEGTNADHPITWVPAGEALTISGGASRATGDYSHAEGYMTKASGMFSHAEGCGNADYIDDSKNPGASGMASHSEGYRTYADGDYSHSEGYRTYATGRASHSGGSFSKAIGDRTFVHGYYVTAMDDDQIAFGNNYDIPGSGTSTEIKRIRTNIFGLPLGNRYFSQSTSYLPSNDTPIKDIIDRNRNGLSVYLGCSTIQNSINYVTILPNDMFGTFLISLEILEGEPNYNLDSQDYAIGILKLTPMGTNRVSNPQCIVSTIAGNSNLFGTILVFENAGYIDGDNVYPKVTVTNNSTRAVSMNSVNKFIRCNIIRLL